VDSKWYKQRVRNIDYKIALGKIIIELASKGKGLYSYEYVVRADKSNKEKQEIKWRINSITYRIPSARLQSWDYGNSGLYFITICTKNREHYFGKILNGEMHLSEIGKIVKSEWTKTFDMRPDMNLKIDEYVVMPNHFHAIIMISDNRYNTGDGNGTDTDAMRGTDSKTNQFGPQSKNLASVIRGFKIGVTTNARKINPDFAWQPRFHNHIIRNNVSLEKIRNYIINNPTRWKADEFHN